MKIAEEKGDMETIKYNFLPLNQRIQTEKLSIFMFEYIHIQPIGFLNSREVIFSWKFKYLPTDLLQFNLHQYFS